MHFEAIGTDVVANSTAFALVAHFNGLYSGVYNVACGSLNLCYLSGEASCRKNLGTADLH